VHAASLKAQPSAFQHTELSSLHEAGVPLQVAFAHEQATDAQEISSWWLSQGAGEPEQSEG